jgi:heme exporter protein D
MIDAIRQFFYMGGYAWYVWSAYALVFVFLFVQWLLPWRRWKKYLRDQKDPLNS